MKFDTSMFNLTFDENIQIFIRLILAFLAGGLIGYQREKAEKPAGLRTHILVCIGSALITLVSIYGFGKMGSDPSRIVAQIVSGIGFLGAGTIFRFGTSVKGLTTAASLWAICGVGIAIGLAITAIVTGSIDLNRIKKDIYSRKGKGFDITGIVLGVLFILFVLWFALGEILVPH